MREPGDVPAVLLHGRLDVILASMLALLSLLSVQDSGWWTLLDLAAATAAALIVRWPRAAGAALCILMAVYLVADHSTAEFGMVAPMIAILGTGMRGQRRYRLWIASFAFLAFLVFAWLTAPNLSSWALGSLAWAAMYAVMWLIGDVFTAYQRAQERAQAAALTEQRVAVARDLHDTVARTLARTTIRAQQAEQDGEDLAAVTAGIQQASKELRWMMSVLRDEAQSTQSDPLPVGSLAERIDAATSALTASGFTASAVVDGDPSVLSEPVQAVLSAAVGEMATNIERHGAPDSAPVLILSVDPTQVEMVAINEAKTAASELSPQSMGLRGLRERVRSVNGELEAGQDGMQWMTRVVVPLN